MIKKKKFYSKFINATLISTDDILPAKYKHMSTNNRKLSKYLFKNKYPNLNKKINQYQAIICNGIFGIGSSREQAVNVLIYSGIKIIISPYFGRIFFRNAWNSGLILFELNIKNIEKDTFIYVNFKRKYLKIFNNIYKLPSLNKYMKKLILNKGIINLLLKENVNK